MAQAEKALGSRIPPQPVDVMLHHGLQHQALIRPDFPAIRQESSSYTFGQLNDQANRVAHELLNRAGPGTALIGILLPHPAHQLIAAAGIWKAGMTALILDNNDPEDRLKQILDYAGVDLIVTTTESDELASGLTQDVLIIEPDGCNAMPTNCDMAYDPDLPAVIVYTSGSMGQPKGVIRTHRDILHDVRGEAEFLGITEADRMSLMMPLNFSLGLKYALTALLNGVTLFSFSALIRGIAPFSAWLENEGITILIPPLGFFRRFADTTQNDSGFPVCRFVILSGDKIYKCDVDKFRRKFDPGCNFICVYGSTETGLITRYRIDGTTPVSDPIPVGRAVGDIELRVVDAQGESKPNGRRGEIVVVGPSLPPGYWKNPSLTAQKFKELPGEEPRRMYFTGDTGTIGEDGLLYLYGRNDNQLKIRGYRVDLSEIESVLNNIRGVAHAVVLTSENSSGEKKLNAYASLSGQESLNATTLRQIAATKLPEYMLPNVVIIDEMPTNARGKVDRQELTTIEFPINEEAGHKALTETERRLVELWKSVFEINNVKPTDDIFNLGAGSLQTMVMCLRANEMFSIDVPYAQILKTPTIEEFAVFIETEIRNSEGLPPIST